LVPFVRYEEIEVMSIWPLFFEMWSERPVLQNFLKQ
jgi:hypothetical protein